MAATDTEEPRADTDAEADGHAEGETSPDPGAGHHPTPKQYVQVAVVLAVLTAMEVSVSFIEVGAAFLPTLIILMAIKFLLVAGWFMHLRFDTDVYTRFMGAGLALAASIYAVVLVNFYTTTTPGG